MTHTPAPRHRSGEAPGLEPADPPATTHEVEEATVMAEHADVRLSEAQHYRERLLARARAVDRPAERRILLRRLATVDALIADLERAAPVVTAGAT